MKRRRLFALASAVGLSALMAASSAQAADMKSVKITAIVEHPALDAARMGIQDELAEQGFKVGETLEWEFQSAQGDVGTAGQIARKFVGDGPDVIVAIATPSAQAAAASARGTIPVVFSAVTDPVGAKLVKSWEAPGGPVTGVSDIVPMKKHLALIKEILPGAKVIGMPHNPGEANAVALVELAKQVAPELGLEIITASAPSSGDVLMATRSLVGKADALYISTDNTVVSAFESVVKVGQDAQLPVFAGDTDSVGRGAIAAVGFDYYDVGRQTGRMVARVLKGENAADIPVEGVDKVNLFVNLGAAKAMGVTLPEAVLQRASKVIE
ncbi:MAG: ABC transporter substrate-binding protein [Magnetospiraceae bacterium]